MQKQEYKKLSIHFPADEFVFLKMACAKQGVSIKDFVTDSIMNRIDEYEAYLDSIAYQKAKDAGELEGPFIPWEQVEKELGWDKL